MVSRKLSGSCMPWIAAPVAAATAAGVHDPLICSVNDSDVAPVVLSAPASPAAGDPGLLPGVPRPPGVVRVPGAAVRCCSSSRVHMRSASAAIVSDGLVPTGPGIAAPSATYSPG